MKCYATVDDVRQLWREMTTTETNKAGYLLQVRGEICDGRCSGKVVNDIDRSGANDADDGICPWIFGVRYFSDTGRRPFY